MACYYVSTVVDVQVDDHESLFKALKEMGITFNTRKIGGLISVEGPGFRIMLDPQKKTAQITRWDNNVEWVEDLKQRYTVEKAKKKAKASGWYITEKKVGNNIQLNLRRA